MLTVEIVIKDNRVGSGW